MTSKDNTDAFLISTDELASRLGAADVLVFDATTGPVPTSEGDVQAQAFFLRQHIPTARWIDQNEVSDTSSPYRYITPSFLEIARFFESQGVSRDTTVVLYSTSSIGWAARLWWLLHSIGFHHARLLDGGWQKWAAEGRDSASGPAAEVEAAPSGSLPVHPRTVFIGRERVLQAVRQHDAHLVDSLAPAQYKGEVPSKNGRRGHIEGAVNVPSSQLLDAASNTFKDVAASAAILAAQGVDKSKPLIAYCGAGIAASVDAFAALRAGYPDVQIYDASLAEWAADPSLPMVPGTP